MKRITATFIAILMVFFTYLPQVSAFNPQTNNFIGIHGISMTPDDVKEACHDLVNGGRGFGGKILLVHGEGEYTPETLQALYDAARDEGCQVIERIAGTFDTQSGCWPVLTEDDYQRFINVWSKTRFEAAEKWVIIGNEVNRGSEWGCKADPASYAHSAKLGVEMFRASGLPLKISLAGLDLAAPHTPNGNPSYYDAQKYMNEVLEIEPTLQSVDFSAVHCYPPNDMTGSPLANGRISIMCHRWVADSYRSAGYSELANKPFVISETGWRADELSARHYPEALNRWQTDADAGILWAVTPFAYKDCGSFMGFSLIKCESGRKSRAYGEIAAFPKIFGDVPHVQKAVTNAQLGKNLIIGKKYSYTLRIKNEGTDVWRSDIHTLRLVGGDFSKDSYSFSHFGKVRPDGTLAVTLSFDPGDKIGCQTVSVGMEKRGKMLFEAFSWPFCIDPYPSIVLDNIEAFPNEIVDGKNAEFQLFEEPTQEFVYRESILIKDGKALIAEVKGVDYDHQYRAVVLVDGALPIQVENVRFEKGENILETPLLLPIDTNRDGQFSLGDLLGAR